MRSENKIPHRPSARSRGFSLIEILVVITIIGLLVGMAVPALLGARESAQVTVCQSNLSNIAKSMQALRMRMPNQNWPSDSGIRFLLTLVKYDSIDKKDTKVYLCPGASDTNRAEGSSEDGSAYADMDSLDSHNISYAGRDQKNYPINKSREGEEVIASDDNEGRNNHRTQTCYVYADGVPRAFDKEIDGRDRGIVFEEDEFVTVGPDSKVEELKKLQID